MREAFISILAVLACTGPTRASEIGKNVNFYKDYLRARSDDTILEGPAAGERMLYFYRTPVQLYPGLLPAIEQEYRKRTGNAFKNHMLSKEPWDGVPGKRSSKAALALMLQGKPLPYYALDNTQEANVEIPTD
ncbi:uncharacterized protein LOC106137662 [Amyelois transitella]|uniref:uncharacterized protein LOC106137662 n=1 Tax=Amyelois transitella TaxID=680683 RepID=UPI00067C6457|nr:uncharacterized protein LOC106137662 [Amyelois transitella]